MTPKHDIIRFVLSGTTGAAGWISLSLEGEFRLTAGIEPNVSSFIATAADVERLGSRRTGTLEFYFNGTLTPDYRMARMRIVDFEPVVLAPPFEGAAGRAAVVYRLFIADVRHRFVPPRGGWLHFHKVLDNAGAEEVTLEKRITPSRFAEVCLLAAGLTAADYVIDAAMLDRYELPQGMVVRGASAIGELGKLLDMIGGILIPLSDGRVRVTCIGDDAVASVPDEQRLGNDLVLPASDRRAPVVIVTGGANSVINTITVEGPSANTWEYVYWDWVKGKWLPLAAMAQDSVRDHFRDMPMGDRALAEEQWYRCIRLNRKFFPCNILQDGMITNGPIDVQAKLAVRQDEWTWVNSDEFVHCRVRSLMQRSRVAEILRKNMGMGVEPGREWDDGTGHNVVIVDERLGRVLREGTMDPLGDFVPLTQGQLKVRFTYEAFDRDADGNPRRDADGQVIAATFKVGFGMIEGQVRKLSPAELAAAERSDERIVIDRPDLVLYSEEGEDQNREDLEAKAEAAARAYLMGSDKPAKLRTGMGWFGCELTGSVSEIVLRQDTPSTTLRINTWWMPGDYYRRKIQKAGKKKGAGDGELPGTDASAARSAAGTVEYARPVSQVTPSLGGGGPADAGVEVRITGAIAGKGWQYEGQILRGSVAAEPGMSELAGRTEPGSDDVCLVLNAWESASTVHLLANQTVHLGRICGRTAGGLAIVKIDVEPTTVMFKVKVWVDGGVPGSIDADCSLTYTIKSERGEVLGTGLTPQRLRTGKCEYKRAADGSAGVAYYDGEGVHLYSVAEEVILGDQVMILAHTVAGTVADCLQVNTTDRHFEGKTTKVTVLEAGDVAGGAWVDWYATGSKCP